MFKIEKPILLELPMPINTKRLLIRPIMPGDGAQTNEAIVESFDLLKEWLPWAKENPPSLEESEITARTFYADFILRKAVHMVMFDNNLLIGMCSLNLFNWHVPSTDIGYWTRLSAQGKGYAQEATNALVLYAFNHMKVRRLTLRCDDGNLASAAIAEKCGFVLESKCVGSVFKPLSDELRTGRHYVRLNAEDIDTKHISW